MQETEEAEIKSGIIELYSELVSFHKLRTRKAGSQRYIDLHLVMPRSASVEEAHRMCDYLEQEIDRHLQDSSVTIHVEPCDLECEQCFVLYCRRRQSP